MRPTQLQFRPPRERTPDYYTLKSIFEQSPKSASFGKSTRFQQYNIWAKNTHFRLGPGTYRDHYYTIQEQRVQAPIYKFDTKKTGSDAYYFAGNHLVYDSRYAQIMPSKKFGFVTEDDCEKQHQQSHNQAIRPQTPQTPQVTKNQVSKSTARRQTQLILNQKPQNKLSTSQQVEVQNPINNLANFQIEKDNREQLNTNQMQKSKRNGQKRSQSASSRKKNNIKSLLQNKDSFNEIMNALRASPYQLTQQLVPFSSARKLLKQQKKKESCGQSPKEFVF